MKYTCGLETITGDVTEAKPLIWREREVILIPHIVNNIKVMGGGVAYALRKKWPEVYTKYVEKCKDTYDQFKDGTIALLGESQRVMIEINKIYVYNMFAQDGIKNEDNPIPIKYCALIKCMQKIASDMEYLRDLDKRPVIHAPEFGGLRAGGNFDFIKELIREIWLENGFDVIIYQYKE